MLKERLNTDSTSFYEKVKSFDFLLVLTVLLLHIAKRLFQISDISMTMSQCIS